jgi:hypothetical protein
VAAVIAAFAVAAPALAGNVTVGRFYTELAQAKHLPSADAAAAETSLRGAGFNLPELELGKGLTEGDMISISNVLGLSVTTQRPEAPVSEAQLNTFMSSFRGQLGATSAGAKSAAPYQTYGQGTGGIDPGNSGNGKGKKKGHNKSSSEPE